MPLRRIRILWLRFRSLFQTQRLDRELDEEVRFHIESESERRIATGMDADGARAATLRSFGDLTQQKEACRDMRRVNFIEDFIRDLRYAGRMLRHSRSFAAVAILSLALGIGANTAIFSLIDTLLLRPLPVPHADRLVELIIKPKQYGFSFSYSLFDYIRGHNQVFSGLFAWSNEIFQARLGADVQNVRGVLASGDYFTAFEVKPQLGRFFIAADDRSGSTPVAVISDRLWTARFGRNPSTIGRALTLDGMNFTIIGVMPSNFSGADIGLHADIVVPLSWEPLIYPARPCLNSKYCWWLVVMGRLRPGVSLEEADAQLRVISRGAMETAIYPGMQTKERGEFLARKVVARSGATGFSFLRFRFNNPLLVLMILVSLVLLIACANLASLLLARATARQREITVRLAIGAGRWRLIRQMLTESLLLSTAGGLLGALLASGLSRFLETFFSLGQEPILLNLTPDWRVLTFLFFATVITAVLFGIAPAIRATRVEIHAGLKEGSRTVQNSERRRPLTKLLLAGQVALSVLLVTGAALFAGSLSQLRSLDRGFDPRGVILFPLSVDARIGGQPEKDEALATLYRQLLKRLEALPGVEAASLMNIVPLGNGGWDNEISIPAGLPETLRTVYMNKIAPHYFAMMHTPLLAGRDFNEHDTESSVHVAILNERAAREYFPKGNAIGSQIGNTTRVLTIIGIVGDAKYMNLRDEIPRTMYLPYSQNLEDLHSMTVGVRVKDDSTAIMTAIRPILRATIPGIPMPQPLLMTDQMNQSLSMERLMALLTLFFGLLALILTSIGLYGTLAYAVTRRTAEIGIRMALGAERRCVIWLVLRENAVLTITGLVVGIAAVLVMSRLISSLLYGITPHDPLALSMAVLILAAVAALASLLPALRASRIDPMNALRYE